MPDFLPVATTTDTPAQTAGVSAAEAVNALADVLTVSDSDPTSLRFGVVTSLADPNNLGRVRVDITDTAWISRSRDITLSVGDRVCLVQQGPVFVVVARLTGGEAQPIGVFVPFAGSTPPTGWLTCDGAAVSRTTYAALFAVIGTTYGAGNGTTTFNLPNMVNRVPVGSGGTYSRGGTGGAASVTLTVATMPTHQHSFSGSGTSDSQGNHNHSFSTFTDSSGDHSHSVGNQSTRNDIQAAAGSTVASTGGGSTGTGGGHSHTLSGGTASTGSHTHSTSISGFTSNDGLANAHENMPPYLAVPYIIRAL